MNIYAEMIKAAEMEDAADNASIEGLRAQITAIRALKDARQHLVDRWRDKVDHPSPSTLEQVSATSDLEVSSNDAELDMGDVDWRPLFSQDEFRGLSQMKSIELIALRVLKNEPEYPAYSENGAFKVDDALRILDWVGAPTGGESLYHRRQNISKLLRRHPNIDRVGKGRYRFVQSPSEILGFSGSRIISMYYPRDVESEPVAEKSTLGLA